MPDDSRTDPPASSSSKETAGVAVKQKSPKSKRKPAPKNPPPRHLPPWKVLLHNDDVNDILHVVTSIVELTTLNPQQATICMVEAHKTGVALLLTTHKERAELYKEQFESKGLTVTIEPAE